VSQSDRAGVVLELRGVRKQFGSVEALRGADFVLRQGEIHGLLGENGAGKSTLMQVAFGLVPPDAGSIEVAGRPARIRSPLDARAMGIGMVHQHFTSIPTLTVAENLRLAGRPAAAAERLEGIDPDAPVESLTVAQKQRLEVLQALGANARILLLDEPTALLAPSEVERLLDELRRFARSGGSVVFISHKLDEVFSVADRVTVLRRGEVTLSGPVAEQHRATVAAAMIGEAAPLGSTGAIAERPVPGAVRVRAGHLEVRAGEIVGLAAVEGNGQRPLLRSLAGLARGPSGAVVARPLAFIPEDRTTEGLVPTFSLTENLVLGLGDDARWAIGPWIRWPAARSRTAELLDEFHIRASGPDALARTLSGGNQQKLIFARALEGRPAVVIAENPTRGLDFRATAFVHHRLRALAASGVAVLVYSTDLDEVLELASRVVVMFRGALQEVPAGATRDRVGAMMLGVEG
jgi:simple sugar transport system ATP-binding protein